MYFSSGEDDGFLTHGSTAYPPITIQLPEEPRQEIEMALPYLFISFGNHRLSDHLPIAE
jgi:hypothetical protein